MTSNAHACAKFLPPPTQSGEPLPRTCPGNGSTCLAGMGSWPFFSCRMCKASAAFREAVSPNPTIAGGHNNSPEQLGFHVQFNHPDLVLPANGGVIGVLLELVD
eukprot:CAMPEP_0204352366 /NCGR_PEP_ID=MMETSP0469-20131031/31837_1 /ASSEMBLY_ACC=CAM_ASM_000384 /TAXON_ID=2969 /ORGANISM="Oxyrrhis marina" /LENGTH=103 /DNA_ID=CAMNT_0051339087 /DNA_START=102 /DNA_END=414 /DNA_ORIENTATION=+